MLKYNSKEIDTESNQPAGGLLRNKAKMAYNSKKIEKKWQEAWNKSRIYKTKDLAKKPKFYALDMFPYPSGAGLHVGHPKGYIATDVVARQKMLEGFNVLHPMGWDAFGLPTENYAIKNKIHPQVATEKNIVTFKKQLEKFGFTYDWDREINTTDPEFYKWTQWIFLKMFERGLAYQSDEPVNWCPSCETVLANEDLENGACERCGMQVVQKKMRQWVLKMTAYADRLLYDLDKKDLDWEDLIKEQQRNWIGRSEGAEAKFPIVIASNSSADELCGNPALSAMSAGLLRPRQRAGSRNDSSSIKIYTTRLDTIFGCTYCVVAPEHPIVASLLKIKNQKSKIKNIEEVEKYIIQAQNKTEMERTALAKEKTGVELKGVKAINPFTNEEIPVWVADYVLGFYGTGAVMAVPAHDMRDYEFAKKYKTEIEKVIISDDIEQNQKSKIKNQNDKSKVKNNLNEITFIDDGILINSGKYTGLTSANAREEMTKWLEAQGIGKKKVNYKMRDWVFSRQRYWGEPFPLVFCENCAVKIKNQKSKIKIKEEFNLGEILNPGWIGVLEKDLPVELPDVESYEPTGTGESPLANIKEWVNVKCPKCGGAGRRETNTMPQWAGSSWYYLRYIDPKNKKALADKEKEKYWMPVDLYVGGAEHATRHLLYARFWHKFLFDIGVVSTEEPFKKLFHVGLVLAEDGRKMSKRWGNVINPDDIIREYGADSLRLYEMFMGPFSQSVSWSTKGVVGTRRFLERIWRLKFKVQNLKFKITVRNLKLEQLIHKTIKKATEDIENFKFNTAISALMIFVNNVEKADVLLPRNIYENFLILLSPFAPHIAEELWGKLGNKKSIFLSRWPDYDKDLIKEEEIEMLIQVNGKLRDKIKTVADISEDEAKKLALISEKIKKIIDSRTIKKVIFVRGRLINLVI